MSEASYAKYRFIQSGAPGLCGTTGIVLRTAEDGVVEARMGIAIFGYTNLSDEEMRVCEYNPFHPEFHDNYVSGKGNTDEEAIESLRADMKQIHESLWL